MTEQEAISKIKAGEWIEDKELSVLNGIAVSALDKQIPCVPMEDAIAHTVFHYCPKCRGIVEKRWMYCAHCGQRMKWG